jgi:hypothetical protein
LNSRSEFLEKVKASRSGKNSRSEIKQKVKLQDRVREPAEKNPAPKGLGFSTGRKKSRSEIKQKVKASRSGKNSRSEIKQKVKLQDRVREPAEKNPAPKGLGFSTGRKKSRSEIKQKVKASRSGKNSRSEIKQKVKLQDRVREPAEKNPALWGLGFSTGREKYKYQVHQSNKGS